MAKKINYQEELSNMQAIIPKARTLLEQAEKKHKDAKTDADKKAALAELIIARKPLQLFSALQWIKLLDDPMSGTGEIKDDYVAQNFDKNLDMLKKLKASSESNSNPAAAFIYQHFGGIIARIVRDDSHPEYKLRIVWFATMLGRLYRGQEATRLLQAHWEDETDLLQHVKAFVDPLIIGASA